MSIGLVLPEDKQDRISMTLNGTGFELHINNVDQKSFEKKLDISIQNKKMYLNGSECEQIIIKNKQRDITNNIDINPIIAGRGFHWQKKINVRVIGNVVIQVIDQSLFVINKIYLEDYLMCVATSEMGSECPSSLLEAQTIVARSWILAATEKKHTKLGLDACNDDCCQRYQGISNISKSSIKAARNTRGKILMYKNTICDTRYSKSCGGRTEKGNNVWEIDYKPYLESASDSDYNDETNLSDEQSFEKWLTEQSLSFCGPKFIEEKNLNKYLGNVDEKGKYHRWEVCYSNDELIKIIFDKTGKQFLKITKIAPKKRGASGRILHLDVMGEKINGEKFSLSIKSEYEIRRILHPKFLYSSAFIIETNSKHNNDSYDFTLKGAGWGHGVGLCQIGALGMSLSGKKTEEIISHYYQQTNMKDIYE